MHRAPGRGITSSFLALSLGLPVAVTAQAPPDGGVAPTPAVTAPAPTLPATPRRYGAGPLQPESLDKLSDAQVTAKLRTYLPFYKLARIARRDPAGALTAVWSAADRSVDLAAATRVEQQALLAALQRRPLDTELDILVHDGAEVVPITVWWDQPDEVTFQAGQKRPPLLSETITAAAIRERFGVGEFTEADQKWDDRALAAVARALALLSPEELELVKGLPFRRARVEGKRRAVYVRSNEPARVNVFDATFLLDGEAFMGEPSSPEADSVGALLHELGHAIADVRRRELSSSALALVAEAHRAVAEGAPDANARIKAANDLTLRLNRIDAQDREGRPAELEFSGSLDWRRSPTEYGRTNKREHFAECFRLYKADPAALKRISPPALAWFAAGNHVKVAVRPLP